MVASWVLNTQGIKVSFMCLYMHSKTFLVTGKGKDTIRKAFELPILHPNTDLTHYSGKEVSCMSAKGLEKVTGLHKQKTGITDTPFFILRPHFRLRGEGSKALSPILMIHRGRKELQNPQPRNTAN